MANPIKPAAARFYVATYGDMGLDVSFYSDPLEYGRAVKEAERLHRADDLDSYVNGRVDEAC